MVFISTFILLIYMYSVWSKLSPSKILTSVVNVENAFESISQIFDDLDYDENEIESTLKKISSNQAALKSMDGLTHQIRSSLGDSISISKRLKTLLNSKQKNLKEASKVLEYVTNIERSLQACEILFTMSLNNIEKRQIALSNIELVEIESFSFHLKGISWKVSLFKPKEVKSLLSDDQTNVDMNIKYNPDELIIAITDGLFVDNFEQQLSLDKGTYSDQIVQMIKVMDEKNVESVPLRSSGLVNEDISLHKDILQMAIMTLNKIISYVITESSNNLTDVSRNNNNTVLSPSKVNNSSASSSSKSSPTLIKKESNELNITNSMKNESFLGVNITVNSNNTKIEKYIKCYKSIRVIGYSVGGSIASYISMIFDGALNISMTPYIFSSSDKPGLNENILIRDKPKVTKKKLKKSSYLSKSNSGSKILIKKKIKKETKEYYICDDSKASLENWNNSISLNECIGLFPNLVKCIAISPLPCVSRILVPQYITSILCGDDIIPRVNPDTLRSLRKRLTEALKSGAGKSSISWNLGGAWISDMKYLAENSINNYASGGHDISSLAVPGRVFYIKARKLKKGASIQRVFRGNWREDMLWLLHEILLSDRMISHHDLLYCARVLARL